MNWKNEFGVEIPLEEIETDVLEGTIALMEDIAPDNGAKLITEMKAEYMRRVDS